jgi:hypothetical protein
VRVGGLRLKGIELEREAKERAQALAGVFAGLSGFSARAAAEELNKRNVPTPAGGKWHATQVMPEILRGRDARAPLPAALVRRGTSDLLFIVRDNGGQQLAYVLF